MVPCIVDEVIVLKIGEYKNKQKKILILPYILLACIWIDSFHFVQCSSRATCFLQIVNAATAYSMSALIVQIANFPSPISYNHLRSVVVQLKSIINIFYHVLEITTMLH